MKVSFPHLGDYSSIAGTTLFQELGVEVLLPPPTTKRTIELGVKHAPEFACFPLKVTLGNFIESLEQGADTLVMPGGIGPCRLGYYAPVQKEILQKIGYHPTMIIGEPPSAGILTMIKRAWPLLTKISYRRVKQAAKLAWDKILLIDHLEKQANKWRPYEKNQGAIGRLKSRYLRDLSQVETHTKINSLYPKFDEELSEVIAKQEREAIKVMVVGEIFLNLDQTANMNIEQKLGKCGAQVSRSVYLSDWIRENFLSSEEHHNKHYTVTEAAKPYLKHFVGGHGRESVGEAVHAKQEGFHGIVHISPFTCMPEITAQGVLPRVTKEQNLPVLSLTFDEQTGEAGINTRLEAFTDLLKKRDTAS